MEPVTIFEISIQKKFILKEWKTLTWQWFNQEVPLIKKSKSSNYFESLLARALLGHVKAEMFELFSNPQIEHLVRLNRKKMSFVLQIIQFPKLLTPNADLWEVFFQKIGENNAIFKFHKETI
jgi:hypothetical protein